MAFTVRDFESLVRLLDRHPEWLEALRQRLLTRELLHAPETLRAIEGTLRTLGETVAALAEAQRRTEEQVRMLTQTVRTLIQDGADLKDHDVVLEASWVVDREDVERAVRRAEILRGRSGRPRRMAGMTWREGG